MNLDTRSEITCWKVYKNIGKPMNIFEFEKIWQLNERKSPKLFLSRLLALHFTAPKPTVYFSNKIHFHFYCSADYSSWLWMKANSEFIYFKIFYNFDWNSVSSLKLFYDNWICQIEFAYYVKKSIVYLVCICYDISVSVLSVQWRN